MSKQPNIVPNMVEGMLYSASKNSAGKYAREA